MTAVIRPPVTYEIFRGLRFEKSFAGETTFAAMFVVICAASTTSAPKMITAGLPIARDELDRIPDRLAEDDDRRAGDGHADEREERSSSSAGRAPGR